MRSGFVDVSSGTRYWQGSLNTLIWSRVALTMSTVIYTSTTSTAYNFNTNSASTPVLPSGQSSRWNGFTLRCLSTAVEGEESGKPHKDGKNYTKKSNFLPK